MTDFVAIAKGIGEIVTQKNEAYGSSVAATEQMLQFIYPNGIRSDQYGDVLLIVRILDKIMRIATKKDAFGESPFQDIAGYGILGVAKDQK